MPVKSNYLIYIGLLSPGLCTVCRMFYISLVNNIDPVYEYSRLSIVVSKGISWFCHIGCTCFCYNLSIMGCNSRHVCFECLKKTKYNFFFSDLQHFKMRGNSFIPTPGQISPPSGSSDELMADHQTGPWYGAMTFYYLQYI